MFDFLSRYLSITIMVIALEGHPELLEFAAHAHRYKKSHKLVVVDTLIAISIYLVNDALTDIVR